MKKTVFFFFIITLAVTTNGIAQFSRYTIQLKDKTGSSYSLTNPSQFLLQRSIDRRMRYGIKIDSTDLPITPSYLDSIRSVANITVLNVSKWLNQVCIKTTDANALAKINAFPFVITSAPIGARPAFSNTSVNTWTNNLPITSVTSSRPAGIQDYYNYGYAYPQIHLHQGEFLHNHGFKGNGMIMAITDEGFVNYNTLSTFDSIRTNNQLLGTWNYVTNTSDVNEGEGHGLACFSTIAANLPGSFVGVAPQSSFYLYVTEDLSTENPIEELNWAAAAEKADSLGVDVLSVSLGYNTFDNSSFNYTYSDMTGHTTPIAKAANLASNKGMLVVAAAGNSGDDAWHYITTPGDADSALSVAAVDVNEQVASFSSYGPNSSGQIKPEVAAVGSNTVIANQTSGTPTYGNGTSFATPIIAGLSTCLWQAFPEVTNMDIIDILHKVSTQYTNPDNRVGYGIPDFKNAFVSLIKKLHTQNASINNCKATINWTAKTAADMSFIVERKLSTDANYLPIDTVSVNSNFQQNNFTFTDSIPIAAPDNNVRYRIKMNIAADTSFYLDSTVLNYTTACDTIVAPPPVIPEEKIVISPNPVTDNLQIQIVRNNPVTVSIEIYALNGQRVYSLSNQQLIGSNTFSIPMKNRSSGIYYVSVFINNRKEVTKEIIR